VMGAMAKGPSEASEQDQLIYGDPKAESIRDTVNRNQELAQYVTVDPVTGAMTMQVPYAAAPSVDAAGFEAEVEGTLSGTFTKGIFKKKSITLSVDLVQNTQNPAFTLAACSPSTCTSSAIQGGWTGGNTRRLEISPTARTGTRVHEFLHFAGLGHQWNRTNSIMSYSATRSLKFTDVERLYGAYP
jgi:hypothetical protein